MPCGAYPSANSKSPIQDYGTSHYTTQDWDVLYTAYPQAFSCIQQASTQSGMARTRDQC